MPAVEPISSANGVDLFAARPVLAGAIPERWLNEYEKLESAERLARLEADQALLADLKALKFEGAHYIYFATELAKYGLAVIGGWTRRGVIFAKVKERGFGGLPQPLAGAFDNSDVVEELAGETVANSLKSFRDQVLMRNKWDPARGASLKTYFIGQCLMQFPNVYRRWHGETYREESTLTFDGNINKLDKRQDDDIATAISRKDEAQRLLNRVSNPNTRQMLQLYAAGLSHSQIGIRMNVTAKTIEHAIARERALLTRGNAK